MTTRREGPGGLPAVLRGAPVWAVVCLFVGAILMVAAAGLAAVWL